MNLKPLSPTQSLNKAYRKEKVNRAVIEQFKTNLNTLLLAINEKQGEEFAKTDVRDFFGDTYYKGKYKINLKDKIDLAIYEGDKPVVIIEAKRPKKQDGDMLRVDNLNAKAMHELMLYYLRERIEHNNTDIHYLIATNVYEWFIFDASVFEKLFYNNKNLVEEYTNWNAGRKTSKSTDFFYNDIARPFLTKLKEEIAFTWFDLRKEYEKALEQEAEAKDQSLVPLYKIFSPAHLLKLPFANDSNTLDTGFYNELLHIIGLEEEPKGGKKLIGRKPEAKRNPASLLENTIENIITKERLRKVNNIQLYGATEEEQLFNVALELCITWVNRILFLKLLEGQLVNYHKGDVAYRFLDSKIIPDYNELDKLFFEVLARPLDKRSAALKKKYANVPYLNSSLFDATVLEEETSAYISVLDDGLELPLHKSTVLKDVKGKKTEGDLTTLGYLFRFLDAYDFSSEGGEQVQEDNKALINASVLGLIFEKINGYKDGSFFTPGFITMYMCRETIRRTVLQKFNEAKGWDCETFDQLYNYIKPKDIKEANSIINSLKLCDPAVGSGHFLVSALNEIIAIKSELGILCDREGQILRDYTVEVVNDELFVMGGYDSFFEYIPGEYKSQRVQEALFHEKQTIIEGCLFGVDINPNSVKICNLRLWIELLKHSYYIKETGYTELETLPNIDINIKCGNSLISRFSLDEDLSDVFKKQQYNLETYKVAVETYKNVKDKKAKEELLVFIRKIKEEFKTVVYKRDPLRKKLSELKGHLQLLDNNIDLFGKKIKKQEDVEMERRRLQLSIEQKEKEIIDIEKNAIYKNALEWRFEFPEVLDDEGRFKGFDVVIGNPPYGVNINRTGNKEYDQIYSKILVGELETYILFYFRGFMILKNQGILGFITPDSWLTNRSASAYRNWLSSKYNLIDVFDFYKPFADAKDTRCHSVILRKDNLEFINIKQVLPSDHDNIYRKYIVEQNTIKEYKEKEWRLYITKAERVIFSKMENVSEPLEKLYNLKYGLRTGNNQKYVTNIETKYPSIAGSDIASRYAIKWYPKYLHTTEELPQSYFNENYTEKKIIVQRIRTNSLNLNARWIEAAYIEGKYIPNDSLTYIYELSKDYSLMYLLGILNSFLINKYYRAYYTDVNVKPTYLAKIPIPAISTKDQIPFIKLVDKILDTKKAKPEADTSKLEKEIDQLVYQLYQLTPEEIQLVEASTK